jgi:hypothetical protein
MDKNFETQVLSRLAVIESKIDDYNKIKDKVNENYTISNENRKEISEIQDKLKWITRTVTGAIIGGIIALAFALIQR